MADDSKSKQGNKHSGETKLELNWETKYCDSTMKTQKTITKKTMTMYTMYTTVTMTETTIAMKTWGW